MYAERQRWPLTGADVELSHLAPDRPNLWIERLIKTPVTKAARAEPEIRTTIKQA